ncbi:MAG: KTSC domain-containing protein [bacterium]
MLNKRYDKHSQHRTRGLWVSREVKHACAVLGLDELPTLEALKKAYKLMVKQWHPDRFHNNQEMEQLAVEKTQRINVAYRLLLSKLEEGATHVAPNGKSRRPKTRNTRHQYAWQTYSDGFPNPRVTEFFLNSSHIVSAGYDKMKKILYLKFLGDEIYLYYDVPCFIFEHLLMAGSPGKYALKFIYDRYRHRKFTPLIRK